jgi:hypothetical protein
MQKFLLVILLANQSLLASETHQQFILKQLLTPEIIAPSLNLGNKIMALTPGIGGLKIETSKGHFELSTENCLPATGQINVKICFVIPFKIAKASELFANAPVGFFPQYARTSDYKTTYAYIVKTKCCCLKTKELRGCTSLPVGDFTQLITSPVE